MFVCRFWRCFDDRSFHCRIDSCTALIICSSSSNSFLWLELALARISESEVLIKEHWQERARARYRVFFFGLKDALDYSHLSRDRHSIRLSSGYIVVGQMSETTKANRKQLLEHRQHVNRGIIDHNNKRAYEEIVKSCIATGRSRLGVAEWENEPRVKRCLNFYLREFAVMFRASSGCERRHRWNQNKQLSVCWR